MKLGSACISDEMYERKRKNGKYYLKKMLRKKCRNFF